MTPIRMETRLATFVMEVDGERSVLDYSLEGTTMDIKSVRVPQAVGGRGLAGQLTQHALDWARHHELAVVPSCPYVAHWIQKHPEYQSLVAR